MKTLAQFTSTLESLRAADWRDLSALERALGREKKATRSYAVNCAGDVCAGDRILFVRQRWERQAINRFGKMANVIAGYDLVEATVEKESYGSDKQQHTFTLLVDGEKLLIKGRNLYAVGVWRKAWKCEQERIDALSEKHERGASARRARTERIQERGW